MLVLLAWAAAPARGGDLEPTAEELFRWGEYDSLVRYLEPWLAARSAGADARSDSLELAKANLFLGVAYHYLDRQSLGAQAFARASRLDRATRLDRLYATPTMVASFDSIAAVERASLAREERERAAARADSATRAARTATLRRRPARWKLWTGGLVAAAGLAAGGVLAYDILVEARPREREIEVGPVAP